LALVYTTSKSKAIRLTGLSIFDSQLLIGVRWFCTSSRYAGL